MGNQLDVSIAIDVEMFQWAANEGKNNRLDGFTIATKEEFFNNSSVRHINHSLKEDMYRAYRAGYSKAPSADRMREYNE